MIQSAKMREDFDKFPELLFSDSTYKLNINDIPLYALIGCDGEGRTRPVSLFLVTDETEETIRNMLELFKADNPKWEQIWVVLTDKDMSQRKCFKEAFPQIDLQLCLFHVLRNFNREISCAKHNISILSHSMEFLLPLIHHLLLLIHLPFTILLLLMTR